MVVDDVWEARHLAPFLIGTSCARIVTTRKPDAVAPQGSELRALDEMSPEEAISVLSKYVPVQAQAEDAPDRAEIRAALATLTERLGAWPLLLNIVGLRLEAEIKRQSTPRAALEWIERRLADAGLTAFDRGSDREHALRASMEVSLGPLPADQRQRLFELSIFPEDQVIPERVALRLWEATAQIGGTAGEQLLRDLDASFLRLTWDRSTGSNVIRFHDRLREYLGEQLSLERTREVHRLLATSYGDATAWSSAPDDGYGFDHLVYHLLRGGQAEAARALVDDRRWWEARIRQAGFTYEGCLADVASVSLDAGQRAHAVIDAGGIPDLRPLVRYLVVRSTVVMLARRQEPAVMSRAVALGMWPMARALAMVARIAKAWQRLNALLRLLRNDSLSPERRAEIEEMILRSAQAATELSAHDLLRAADAVRTPAIRQVLVAMARREAIDDPLRRERRSLLGRADGSQDFHSTARESAHALAAVARRLEGPDREDAIARGQTLAMSLDSKERAHALAAYLPLLGPAEHDRVLADAERAALDVANHQERVFALSALALGARDDARSRLIDVVWGMVADIADEPWRAFCLSRVAPLLTGERLRTALELAERTIDSDRRWGERGWQLARRLFGASDAAAARIVAAVRNGADVTLKAERLSQLGTTMTTSELETVIDRARDEASRRYEGDQAFSSQGQLLAAVAEQLSSEQVTRVLELARLDSDWVQNSFTLLELGRDTLLPPRPDAAVTPSAPPQATEAEARVELDRIAHLEGQYRDRERLNVLLGLAPRMPRSLIGRAAEVARMIDDPWVRAHALTVVAGQAEGEERLALSKEALESNMTSQTALDDRKAAIVEWLAPMMDQESLRPAIGFVAGLEEWTRKRALKAIAAASREPTVLSDLVRVTERLSNDAPKQEILERLQIVPDDLVPQVLAVIEGIVDTGVRTSAFIAFSRVVSVTCAPAFLAHSDRLHSATQRARARAALLPRLAPTPSFSRELQRARHDLVDLLVHPDELGLLQVLGVLRDRTLFGDPIVDAAAVAEIARTARDVHDAWKSV
jgi:hypothetical protein